MGLCVAASHHRIALEIQIRRVGAPKARCLFADSGRHTGTVTFAPTQKPHPCLPSPTLALPIMDSAAMVLCDNEDQINVQASPDW